MRLYDYAASANCYKARLLLALLGREYERVPIDIFAGDTLTDAFASLNPARETPVLELDDGRVLTQSNAILWFLGEGTAFLPESALGRAQVAQWLFFEQERVMSGIGSARFRIMTGRDPELVPARLELAESALSMLDAHLAGRSYLVGDSCSVADLANFAYTHVAEDAGFSLAGYPSVSAWLGRVAALPRFVDDLVPYPENARPGRSRSIIGSFLGSPPTGRNASRHPCRPAGSQRERLEGFQLDGVLKREDVAVLGEQFLTPFVGMECVELAAAGEGHQLNFERQGLVLIVSAPPAVQQAGSVALQEPQHFILVCGRSFSGRRVRVPHEPQCYRLLV